MRLLVPDEWRNKSCSPNRPKEKGKEKEKENKNDKRKSTYLRYSLCILLVQGTYLPVGFISEVSLLDSSSSQDFHQTPIIGVRPNSTPPAAVSVHCVPCSL